MTPFELTDAALIARGKDWKWLADTLGQRQQTVNHWRKRGIPAMHYQHIEDALGKHRGWILGETGQDAVTNKLSLSGNQLGAMFDLIPDTDVVRKLEAFNACSAAILKALRPE